MSTTREMNLLHNYSAFKAAILASLLSSGGSEGAITMQLVCITCNDRAKMTSDYFFE
jgi:hypothetical protein